MKTSLKSFVGGVVVGFAASCAVAFASSASEHNGKFWNGLNREGKNGYVSGYADAIEVSVSKIDALMVAADLVHWKGSRKIINEIKMQLSVAEIDPAARVIRLDRLYRNRTNSDLDLGTALQLMALHPAANQKDGSHEK